MSYRQEIDALSRWIYQTTGLSSILLSDAPPQVARPVILWEAPNRRRGRDLGNYGFERRVTQYGTLYITHLFQLADIVESLESNIAERFDILPVFASDELGAPRIGWLKKVELEVNNAQGTDVGISIRYTVNQDRPTPVPLPPATKVVTKIERGSTV